MANFVSLLMLVVVGTVMSFAVWILRAAVRIRRDKERNERERQESFDFDDSLPHANHG